MKKQKKIYQYMTNNALKKFDLEVFLSTDFKLYFRGEDIPKELQESFSGVIGKQNKFDSFDELNQKVLSIIADFESKFVEETKQKVILYSIETDSNKGEKISLYYRIAQRIDIKSSKNVETRYYTERRVVAGVGGLNQKHLDEFNTYHEFNDEFNEMPWTKEREYWFEQMSGNIKNLGERLLEGFGKKAEILARKIDQGGLGYLLIEAKED